MLDKTVLDRNIKTPLHKQISHRIRETLSERFADGDRFYTDQELAEGLGVSRLTVRRAMDDLVREGLLLRRAGSGSVVRLNPGMEACSAPPIQPTPRLLDISYKIRTITLIGHVWNSEYPAAVVDCCVSLCRSHGVELRLRCANVDSEQTILPDIGDDPSSEALLLFVGERGARRINNSLRGQGYRTVSLAPAGGDFEGHIVGTDARLAVRLGLEHLRSLNHESIVLLVTELLREESVMLKVEEFQERMTEFGLYPRVVVSASQGYAAAYAAMDEVMECSERFKPTAIITVADTAAWAALEWFREREIVVPKEVSVVGFEDSRSSKYVTPSLTTIAHPIQATVERALEILTSASWSKPSVHEYIVPTLCIRHSTGPAPIKS